MTWTRFSYVIPACSIYIFDNKQQPIFIQEGEKFILKVWTFEQIGSVLKVAGDKKCQEAQACLEGTTCTYVFFFFFFNFYVFSTLHCKPQGTVRQTEQEVGRGQERGVGGDGQATCQE